MFNFLKLLPQAPNSVRVSHRAKILPLILAMGLGCWEVLSLAPLPQKALAVPQETSVSQTETELHPRYEVVGDREGQVIVKDTATGEVIRTFQMNQGVVVTETFLLNNGQTVGASQKNNAVFWDLETGREIGRVDQRVYGFSDDEKKFWTFGSQGLLVHSYPEMIPTCQLSQGSTSKEGLYFPGFQFSPNNHFLEISFLYNDYYFGVPGNRNIYDLEKCQIIPLSSQLPRISNVAYTGRFTPDSRFYEVRNVRTIWGRGLARVTLRLNLETYEVEQVFESYIQRETSNN